MFKTSVKKLLRVFQVLRRHRISTLRIKTRVRCQLVFDPKPAMRHSLTIRVAEENIPRLITPNTVPPGSINRDHVHLLISIPPQLSVSRAVQFLKGKSSRGYWVVSSGNVTDEVWKEYIENQKPPEPDDDFNVV